MKKYYYIFVCFALVMTSCKKEEIPEMNPGPGSEGIFLNGMLGTEAINLNSSGNYYMHSSYTFDTAKSVYVFTGELKERNCTECGPGIKLMVRNYKQSPNGELNFDLDSLFKLKTVYWNDFLSSPEKLGLAELVLSKDGFLMSSGAFVQPRSCNLEIKKVELYNQNELGQNTVKVTFEGKVYLNTSMGEKLFVFDGTFAFAYP